MYDKFEKREPFALLDTSKYPPEVAGRFNSFITTQFDDSLSVEMQMRSIIKWAIDNFKEMDETYNNFTDFIVDGSINPFIEFLNDLIEYMNEFVDIFDDRYQETILDKIQEWYNNGELETLINESLDTKYHQMDERLNTQLAQITINVLYPPEDLEPMVADGDYYNETNQKYYKDSAMTQPSTDNKTRLQAIVDYVHEQGGGNIYLPTGNYVVRSRITWKSKVSMTGSGMTSSTLLAEGELFDTIVGVGTDSTGGQADEDVWLEDFELSNFGIDNKGLTFPYSTINGKALFILYCRRATFRRLLLQNTIGTALGCDFIPDCVMENNVIINAGRNWGQPRSATDETPRTIGQSGIGIGTGALEWEPSSITNNFVYNSGNFGIFVEDQTTIDGERGKGTKIYGNHVEGNRVGLANLGTGDTKFSLNYVFRNREDGIELIESVRDNTIVDNDILENGRAGIYLVPFLSGYNNTISNNRIYDNEQHGIHLRLTGSQSDEIYENLSITNNEIYRNGRLGILIGQKNKFYTVIKDNEIYNNGQKPVTVSDNTALRVNGENEYTQILGNIFYDNQEVKTQEVAIRMEAPATDYLIKDNVLIDQETSIIPTTGLIRNNYGRVDRGGDLTKTEFGKVTFEADTTYVNVNHYLGRPADSITLTPSASVDVWVGDNTENNRTTIRRANDSVGEELTVYWTASIEL